MTYKRKSARESILAAVEVLNDRLNDEVEKFEEETGMTVYRIDHPRDNYMSALPGVKRISVRIAAPELPNSSK